MDQFGEFDWSPLSVFRLFTVLTLICFVYQMAIMLSHYWFRIMPLRKEMSHPERLLAPPIGWTFSYHLLVAVVFTVLGVSMVQAIYKDAPGTVLPFIAPFLIVALTVVVNRFVKYYSNVMSDDYRRGIGPKE